MGAEDPANGGAVVTADQPIATSMGTRSTAPPAEFVDDIPEGSSILANAAAIVCFPITMLFCCVCLDPKEEMVITNCGTYTGTITEPGVHVTNPWGRETRKITTAQITADIPNIKVLDANGNPILVSAILTYKFINSKRALLNVANPYEYVTQQATTVLKQVVSKFPYESHDEDVPTLKNETEHIAQMLISTLQPRVDPAGAQILNMQLNELNYAPEIAAAMLRVQQAKALIAAREHIVTGAVDIAKSAVERLEDGGLVFTDSEKVKLVSNLLLVMTGDHEAVPTVPLT